MIRIEALGGLRILVNGEESVPLAKQRLKSALLVYLAVERSCMREALIGTFWPEREPERARHVLSQTVYELRKHLGEEWLTITGDRLTVSDRVTSDVVEFTEAVEKGALENALRLYHGGLLDGTYLAESNEFEQWCDRRNQRITKLLRRALKETCELPEVAGWIELAIEVARKSAERDQTDDEIQHALLQLLVRAGRRTDALRQYETYEAALAADDLEPLEHTRALIATIREATESVEPVVVTPFSHVAGARQPDLPRATGAAAQVQARDKAAERARARKRSGAVAGGAVVVALAIILPILLARGSDEAAPPSAAAEPRIAVLPFDDNSPEKNLGYLTNALTEGLIDALNVRGLDVRSKGAVRHWATQNIPQDSLARLLNVDWLVDGSLARSGDNLRATVSLIEAASGSVQESADTAHAWSNFFELRDTLVADVAVLLRRALGREIEVRQRRAETRSEKAWENYFRAKQLHDDFIAYMLANGVDAAETMLGLADSLARNAATEDPRWVAPLILRGRLAVQRVQVLLARPGTENSRAIRAALEYGVGVANRAIKLDENLPDGYELRGVLLYRLRAAPGVVRDTTEMRRLERGVEKDLTIAVTKDSARAESWSILSELYLRQSRMQQAQHTALRAYEADSYYSGALDTLYRLAVSSFEMGDDQAARKWCDEGRRRYPRYHNFVYCALMLMAWSDGVPANIDSAWRLTLRSDLIPTPAAAQYDVMFRLMTASVIARAGKPDSALHVIEAIPQNLRAGPSSLWIEAAARARLGDFARAENLVNAYVANQGLPNSWQLNSRALKPVTQRYLKAATPADRR